VKSRHYIYHYRFLTVEQVLAYLKSLLASNVSSLNVSQICFVSSLADFVYVHIYVYFS
jgi:hypothetical protein